MVSDKDDTIKLSLSSEKLNGDLEKDCKANIEIIFSDLSVQIVGNYNLIVYLSGINTKEISLTVKTAIQAIDFLMPSGFTVNVSGEITVTVYDTVGKLWLDPEKAHLETDDGSFEKMSVDLSNGVAKFNVIFKSDGTKTLLISTNSGTNKIAFAPVGSRIMKYLTNLSSVI